MRCIPAMRHHHCPAATGGETKYDIYIYIYICVCDVCSRAPEPAPEHVMKRKMRGCGPWPIWAPTEVFDGS